MLRKLLTGMLVAVTAISSAHAKLAVGDTPPDDLGKNRQGDEIRISDHRGKVVVLTFWATWCGYCRKELPVLGGLQKAVGKNRLEVIAINLKEDRKTYLAAVRQLKDSELTLTHDTHGRIGDQFGVSSLPHLFMLDKQGKVAYVHIGYGENLLPRFVDEVNELLVQPYVAEQVPTATPTTTNGGGV